MPVYLVAPSARASVRRLALDCVGVCLEAERTVQSHEGRAPFGDVPDCGGPRIARARVCFPHRDHLELETFGLDVARGVHVDAKRAGRVPVFDNRVGGVEQLTDIGFAIVVYVIRLMITTLDSDGAVTLVKPSKIKTALFWVDAQTS